jgi:hypothetical protein
VADISASLGTGIAAVNETNHLRVYTQDCQGGIRESIYEGKWSNGKNVIVQGKIGSPLAACSQGLEEVGLSIFCDTPYLEKAELYNRSVSTMSQLITSSVNIAIQQKRVGMPAVSMPATSLSPLTPRSQHASSP